MSSEKNKNVTTSPSSNRLPNISSDQGSPVSQSVKGFSDESILQNSSQDVNNLLERVFKITLNHKYAQNSELVSQFLIFLGQDDAEQSVQLLGKDNLDEVIQCFLNSSPLNLNLNTL